MYPGQHAQSIPDKPAAISSTSGETISYAELDARSKRLAQLFWAEGLRPGDHVALFLENHLRYFEVTWAALRSGLFLTTVNRYLTEAEAAYIVDDCGAKALVSSLSLQDVALEIPPKAPACKRFLMIDGPPEGKGAFDPYEAAIAQHPTEPLAEEPLGEFLLYSSGTTGRPKGISLPLLNRPVSEGLTLAAVLRTLFRFDENSVYLSPAPLYHSAPIGFTTAVQSLGGTVVMMDRFDALDSLRAIEEHAVTHS